MLTTTDPVPVLRRHAVDAAYEMDTARTQKAREYAKGELFAYCTALTLLVGPDTTPGIATDGFTPLRHTGERTLRAFLGPVKAREVLGG